MSLDYLKGEKLTEIKVADVDLTDAPKFSDAYIDSCLVDGRQATDDELEYINDKMPWVANEAAHAYLQHEQEQGPQT